MSDCEAPALNPWFQVWIRPRATIQRVVETDRRWLMLSIAGLLGVASSISIILPGFYLVLGWHGLLLGVPLVMLVGVYALFLSAALVGWTGRWIGGLATDANLRAALACAGIPMVWGLLVWIPRTVWFDSRLVDEPMLIFQEGAPEATWIWYVLLFDLILNAWATVLLVKTVAQVQGFSAWRALANLILAVMVVVSPLVLLIPALVAWTMFGQGM